ncbi:MAG: 2-succinyl-5-enolpyruvyl-6-hydroxy-3-cyclohexene-1-carboxylic-acid synthase, partial [Bacteroidota bacterium]
PVVIACTSGSAALNYAPAVAEAYYQHIPMIVVTADRPVEWIDRGEGQSIRQRNVFANFIQGSYDLIQEATDRDLIWHNELLINQAIETSLGPVPGPVHVNIPFREGLYGVEVEPNVQPNTIHTLAVQSRLSGGKLAELASLVRQQKKVLVITGLLPVEEGLQAELENFAENEQVLVLTETTSNLHSKRFVDAIDRLLVTMDEEEERQFRPDLLITLGGLIVSKKIKALLRCLSPKAHWHIAPETPYMDTFQALTVNIPLPPADFFQQLNGFDLQQESSYQQDWLARHRRNQVSHREFMAEEAPFCDLKAMEAISVQMPTGANFQMGNSTVVRYVQLRGGDSAHTYHANRGTSGIDGVTSTAAGAAHISQLPTTVVTGELAFLYDSNALWNNYLAPQLKIIVINNGGGGIFRIIPGPRTTEAMAEYFETQHELKIKPLADMYGLPHRLVNDETSLAEGLKWLYETEQAAILEVCTPREVNDQALRAYFAYLKSHKLDPLPDPKSSSEPTAL